ncbi:MAG: hypothetical protein IT305_07115 [Chloroflexi bacterium]|nr:hypothetical protein [Chloroflexota bacterium]
MTSSPGPSFHAPTGLRLADLVPALISGAKRFAAAGVIPVAVFYLAYRLAGPLEGIVCGMAVSLAVLAVQLRRLGRLDPIVLVPMAIILAQGTVAAMTGSVEIYLAAPAVENVIWGVLLIGSVVVRRPLVSAIVRELGIVPPAHGASAAVVRAFTVVTVGWGIIAFGKAVLRIWLLAVLPLEAFLIAVAVANTAINGTMLGLSIWLPLRASRGAPSAAR